MRHKLKNYKIFFLSALFLFDVFAGIIFLENNFNKDKSVIFFDVGQGDAAMISVEPNIQVLIDGGNGNDILEKLGKYMDFYDKNIELIIMTHPDKDHIGGLVEVLKYYKVEKILQTGVVCNTETCKEFDKLANEKNIPVFYAKFGQNIRIANKAYADVLYPFENLKGKEIKNDNDSSIVIRLSFGNINYLFTGDITSNTEKKLLTNDIVLSSEVLKVAHHGSKYSTSLEFLKNVFPKKAVISVGKNSYGHPNKKIVNRLENLGVEVLRTDKFGDILLK